LSQILKSLPWDKVDIRVMTLEICRKKLNEKLTDKHVDQYQEIVDYLDSVGYREAKVILNLRRKKITIYFI
jgi:hypothetical protein